MLGSRQAKSEMELGCCKDPDSSAHDRCDRSAPISPTTAGGSQPVSPLTVSSSRSRHEGLVMSDDQSTDGSSMPWSRRGSNGTNDDILAVGDDRINHTDSTRVDNQTSAESPGARRSRRSKDRPSRSAQLEELRAMLKATCGTRQEPAELCASGEQLGNNTMPTEILSTASTTQPRIAHLALSFAPPRPLGAGSFNAWQESQQYSTLGAVMLDQHDLSPMVWAGPMVPTVPCRLSAPSSGAILPPASPNDKPLKVFMAEYACVVVPLNPHVPAKKRPPTW